MDAIEIYLSQDGYKIYKAYDGEQAIQILDKEEIHLLGGTSGGARPKIMTTIDNEEWIIKFPAHVDGKDAGKMEYDYSCCAKACGIMMSETRLFPSEKCKGYFGTKRFDRRNCLKGKKKVHMLTTAAILELDFEQPSLDYHGLMKLTKIMTRNCDEDVENMFRRMCFNVFAHNRDDHSKNFTYLYEADEDKWHLSPAYDLTYSNTYYGEHTTSVDGNGRNPGRKELLAVGTGAGMKKTRCEEIIDEIEEMENWDQVATDDGYIGYIDKKKVGEAEKTKFERSFKKEEYSYLTMDSKVNMVWHQVTSTDANAYFADATVPEPLLQS